MRRLVVLGLLLGGVAEAQTTGVYGLDFSANNSQVVSAAGHLRLRYNSATGALEQSIAGAAYTGIGGSTVGLNGAYTGGVVASDNIVLLTSTLGPVLVRDNAVPIGGSLMGVQSSGGTTKFFDVTATGITINPAVATSGSPSILTLTGAANTTLAASTEAIDVLFNMTRAVQFATGDIGTQRNVVIKPPTYNFVGISTIADAATVAITNAPFAGANAGITRRSALWVQAGMARLDGTVGVQSGGVASYPLVVGPDLGGGFVNTAFTVSKGAATSVSAFIGADQSHGIEFGWNNASTFCYVNSPGTNISFQQSGVSRLQIDTNGNTDPGADNTSTLGLSNFRWSNVWSMLYATANGAILASAATISPAAGIHHVSGTTQINTINLPVTGFVGSITLVPDGVWSTGTSGNIANAVTAIVNQPVLATYDGSKWSLVGGAPPVATQSYTAPTLLNSWVGNGGGYVAPGYTRDTAGYVKIRGLLKGGSISASDAPLGGTKLFVLPAGYRPSGHLLFSQAAGATVATVSVDTSGNVAVNSSQNSYLTLDGIAFYAEQ